MSLWPSYLYNLYIFDRRKGLKDQCNSSSGAIVSAIGHMNHDWFGTSILL
jgi:hypothetical protein